jgi:hypothetical protein
VSLKVGATRRSQHSRDKVRVRNRRTSREASKDSVDVSNREDRMVVDGIDVDIDVQASPATEGTERLIERGRGDVGHVGMPKISVGTKAEAMKGQRASTTIRVISEGADIEATPEESRARRT